MSSQLIGRINLGLADKLQDRSRRRRMFVRMAQDEIAMQIRALREKRGLRTQSEFARYARMQQSAVSRIENADYKGWTFKTLLKVADALDARLRISFEPAEEVMRRMKAIDSDTATNVIELPYLDRVTSIIEGAPTAEHCLIGVRLEYAPIGLVVAESTSHQIHVAEA